MTDNLMISALKIKKPSKIEIMKNEKTMDFLFSRIISPKSSLNEISTNEDYEKFCNVRDEMNKFIINLNHSGLSETVPDQIHYLYVALIHIENVEKEIISSCLTEEMLSQNKIIEDINCLKIMVLDYIRELSKYIDN
jgi:hypothetical protein